MTSEHRVIPTLVTNLNQNDIVLAEKTLHRFLHNELPNMGLDFKPWEYQDAELYGILLGMFVSLGLIPGSQSSKLGQNGAKSNNINSNTSINNINSSTSIDYSNTTLSQLLAFVRDVDLLYKKNSYHSFRHACDVTYLVYYIIHDLNGDKWLGFSKLEICAVLLAALGHDILHPGTNNSYQVNAQTPAFKKYGKSSPLEKQSLDILWDLVHNTEFIKGLDLQHWWNDNEEDWEEDMFPKVPVFRGAFSKNSINDAFTMHLRDIQNATSSTETQAIRDENTDQEHVFDNLNSYTIKPTERDPSSSASKHTSSNTSQTSQVTPRHLHLLHRIIYESILTTDMMFHFPLLEEFAKITHLLAFEVEEDLEEGEETMVNASTPSNGAQTNSNGTTPNSDSQLSSPTDKDSPTQTTLSPETSTAQKRFSMSRKDSIKSLKSPEHAPPGTRRRINSLSKARDIDMPTVKLNDPTIDADDLSKSGTLLSLRLSIVQLDDTLEAKRSASSSTDSPKNAITLPTPYRRFMLSIILHACDISNAARPTEIMRRWSDLITDEFFKQGDLERILGVPLSPNMDRESANQARCSLDFNALVVRPLFRLLSDVVPPASIFLEWIERNRQIWESELLDSPEITPPPTPTGPKTPIFTSSVNMNSTGDLDASSSSSSVQDSSPSRGVDKDRNNLLSKSLSGVVSPFKQLEEQPSRVSLTAFELKNAHHPSEVFVSAHSIQSNDTNPSTPEDQSKYPLHHSMPMVSSTTTNMNCDMPTLTRSPLSKARIVEEGRGRRLSVAAGVVEIPDFVFNATTTRNNQKSSGIQ